MNDKGDKSINVMDGVWMWTNSCENEQTELGSHVTQK